MTNRQTRAPMTAAQAIGCYLKGKDRNHPHLMASMFAEQAELTMQVESDAISFPPEVHGREAIVRLLASDFGRNWENVTTACVCAPPIGSPRQFSCAWLVVMTAKTSGEGRIGAGQYDWRFDPISGQVLTLNIAIRQMQCLTSDQAPGVLDWASGLPYLWCSVAALDGGPNMAAVEQAISIACNLQVTR